MTYLTTWSSVLPYAFKWGKMIFVTVDRSQSHPSHVSRHLKKYVSTAVKVVLEQLKLAK